MREGIHPEYATMGFRDIATGHVFVTRSTLVSRPGLACEVIDGVEMPVLDIEISSASHPLWTGQARVIDTEGRVEAFRRRYGAGS
jgi:large subunit ribosomal protein L31